MAILITLLILSVAYFGGESSGAKTQMLAAQMQYDQGFQSYELSAELASDAVGKSGGVAMAETGVKSRMRFSKNK